MFKFFFIFHIYADDYNFPESYSSRIQMNGILNDVERKHGQLNILKLIGRGKMELRKDSATTGVVAASTFTSNSYEQGLQILIGQLKEKGDNRIIVGVGRKLNYFSEEVLV